MKFEIVSEGHRFVEAPRVDDSGALYFTDLIAGGVYKRYPDGRLTSFLLERFWIGGLVFNQDGALICAGLGGLVRYDEDRDKTTPLLTEINGTSIIAINDIYADDSGSIYGGTVDFVSISKGRSPSPGVLFRFDPPDQLTVLRDNVNVSNGIGLSPDRRLLYHSETSVGVWVYELDDRRNVLGRRLFASMSDSDGLAVDAAGGVWVASLGSGRIIRFLPDATVGEEIELPVKEGVSLTFAGVDMRDMYIAAGGDIFDPLQRRAAIYRCRSPFAGQSNPKARF